MRGFVGAAMVAMTELEYSGIVEKLGELDKRFTARSVERTPGLPEPALHGQ